MKAIKNSRCDRPRYTQIVVFLIMLFLPLPGQAIDGATEWKVPIYLNPTDNTFTIKNIPAEDLNVYIDWDNSNNSVEFKKMMEEEETLSKDQFVKVNFQQAEFRTTVSALTPGIILNSTRTQSISTYFYQDETIVLTNLQNGKLFIKSNDLIQLNKVSHKNKKIKWEFPKNATLSVEVKGQQIPAQLIIEQTSIPQVNNPIRLQQTTAPAETKVEYQIQKTAIEGKGKDQLRLAVIFLDPDVQSMEDQVLKVSTLDISPHSEQSQVYSGFVSLPKNDNWLSNKPILSIVRVTNEDGTVLISRIDQVITSKMLSGILIAALVVIFLLFFIPLSVGKGVIADDVNATIPDQTAKGKRRLQFAWRFILIFAKTPVGRYSISLAQILFWTFMVIFIYIMVAVNRMEFLSVTPQILVLLGISSATALASKGTAMLRFSEIPDKYFEYEDKKQGKTFYIRKNRTPRFSDLFCLGRLPNIFKLQIFAFTVVAGGYVLIRSMWTGNLPILDDNLLMLMGISGGVYVTNELISETVWEKVKSLISQVDEQNEKLAEIAKYKAEIAGIEQLRQNPQTTVSPELDTRFLELTGLVKKLELEKPEEHILIVKKKIFDELYEVYQNKNEIVHITP